MGYKCIGIYQLYIGVTTFFYHKWARIELGHINLKNWNYNFLKTLCGLKMNYGISITYWKYKNVAKGQVD
jgi:hypothetical protein